MFVTDRNALMTVISSDRTIREDAQEIRGLASAPVG